MKIGINARFLQHPYTGIGQYTKSLIMTLAQMEPQNEYFLFLPELSEISFPENCHQIRVVEKENSSKSIQKANWEHVLLPAEMQKVGVNIAHFLYPSNPWRKLPMPTIVTVHDVIPWVIPEYSRKLRSKIYHMHAKLALKKADHIITVSEFSKSEIIKYLKIQEKNITVTPLAPPLTENPISYPDLPLRRKFFLYVGGYDERKNVVNLLIAYQKHIAPFYQIDLIMVGGKNKGLDEIITDEFCDRVDKKYPLKLKGKVVFTDSLEQSELQCLYRQAMALVHVSTYEGFNLPLVEALSAGIPIVTSDIPVHREVTKDNALFVDPHDINAIGNGMHQLINDPALQRELSAQGKERSRDFSWEKTAEETLYVYNLFA